MSDQTASIARSLRRAREISQLRIATACGTSQSRYSRWERGLAQLKPEQLAVVERLLGVELRKE